LTSIPENDLVIVTSFYPPYASGIANSAQGLAQFLSRKGRAVAVVTTRHSKRLPRFETVAGVSVYREPVVARVDRAAIALGLTRRAVILGRGAAAVNLQLPLPEAGLIAQLLPRGKIISTYYCDPPNTGPVRQRAIARAIDLTAKLALRRSKFVVACSTDYAENSRILRAIDPTELFFATPPVKDRSAGHPRYRLGYGRHFGFLGRMTFEKGLDVLVQAFRQSASADDRLLIAGPGEETSGPNILADVKRLAGADSRISFLGKLPEARIPDFYASLDAFVLPSTNSFEAFGISQAEAMTAGCPVIATDLPGVRGPVQIIRAGSLCTPGDVGDLGKAIRNFSTENWDRPNIAKRAIQQYAQQSSMSVYELLLQRIQDERDT
jgi:glycosyltransferase involved in cell wall biosynthesis